eukprot:3756853-Rhodomonas_salina.1
MELVDRREGPFGRYLFPFSSYLPPMLTPFTPTYLLCFHPLLLPMSFAYTFASFLPPVLTPFPLTCLLCLHRFILPTSHAYTAGVSSFLCALLTPVQVILLPMSYASSSAVLFDVC